MQASMVHACAPVASLVAPRAVAKSTVVAKTSAPFGSALRVKPSASARGVAIQCRVTTEDPQNNFIPDYGRITAYRGATGFGIRLDGGTAYSGAVITRFYDPLLEKVTAWAPSPQEAARRMDRALREFRIRGVATNLTFLEAIITHPQFMDYSYTTRFIDETPELFSQVKRADRGTKLLTYLADVTVNGHPEVKGRPRPSDEIAAPVVPFIEGDPKPGTKQLLDKMGPEKFAKWMRNEKRVLMTDTTMREKELGFLQVVSTPLTRSSYHAGEVQRLMASHPR